MVPDGEDPLPTPPPPTKAPADGRKEFSVTFYDLDGHSKITQDDIAGLVRNIYAALNDSIAVPQGGKKTIKVHLTVTSSEKQSSTDSEQQQQQQEQTPNNNNNNNNINNNNARQKCNNAAAKLRKNLNVTIQENLNHQNQHECSPKIGSELKTPVTTAKFDQIRTPNRLSFRGCRNRSPEIIQDCTASPLHHRKKWREQAAAARRAAAGSIRPDLCELLRENMEENNVNCCRHHHNHHHHGRPAQQSHQHHHHHRCSHNQIIDPDCPVLPLYHCNNEETCPSSKPAQHCRSKQCVGNGSPQQPPPQPFSRHGSCRRSSHQHHTHHHVHHHSRSRSHDGHNNNNAHTQNLFNYKLLSESEDPLTAIESSKSKTAADEILKKCSNLIEMNDPEEDTLELLLGIKNNFNKNNSSSFHHQLKHRNREQEHARAMAQVISWLQRDIIGAEKNFQRPLQVVAKPTAVPAVPPSPPKTAETVLSTPSKNIKKHEHHHVHHHYLHYAKETPIIV